MNNKYKLNYLYDLEQNYFKIAQSKPLEFDRLYSAILTIEKSNRSKLWRIIEYVACFFEVLCKKHITNYSIWRCQVKISMIFDFYNVDYCISGKRIFYKGLSKKQILNMLFRDKYIDVIANILNAEFGKIYTHNLNSDNLEAIALFYSRNIEFNGELNYFSVLKHLYFSGYEKLSWIILIY